MPIEGGETNTIYLPVFPVVFITVRDLLIVPDGFLVLLRLHVAFGSPQNSLGVVVVQNDGLATVLYTVFNLAQLK